MLWAASPGPRSQFEMRVRTGCHVFFGVLLLALQLASGGKKASEKGKAAELHSKVEELIVKVLTMVRDYYDRARDHTKCIPDDVPDKIMRTVKTSIDCVADAEGSFRRGEIDELQRRKQFLRCFGEAKKEVAGIIARVNATIDHCPKNVTEKTYQINVTTAHTETFNVRIRNGLDVFQKTVELVKREGEPCLADPDKSGRRDAPLPRNDTDPGAESYEIDYDEGEIPGDELFEGRQTEYSEEDWPEPREGSEEAESRKKEEAREAPKAGTREPRGGHAGIE